MHQNRHLNPANHFARAAPNIQVTRTGRWRTILELFCCIPELSRRWNSLVSKMIDCRATLINYLCEQGEDTGTIGLLPISPISEKAARGFRLREVAMLGSGSSVGFTGAQDQAGPDCS
jgi:hypothetical protein